MVDDQDQALVRQCLDGHTRAFEALVDRYQKPLFNVALRMLDDAQDAEDITQTVFIKAFEKLATYDDRYKFFSWIYKMTVNEALNFTRPWPLSRRATGNPPRISRACSWR